MTTDVETFEDLVKREFSSDERKKLSKKRLAMSDGSFPIEDQEDVDNAWRLRSKSKKYGKEAIESHIRRACKRLKLEYPGDDEEDVEKLFDDFSIEAEISKTDEDEHLVFGWAQVAKLGDGTVVVDRDEDQITKLEHLERAAYDFVLHSRDGGEMHVRKGVGTLVESFMVTPEKLRKMGLAGDSLPLGWWVGYKVHDPEVWKAVKSGKYKMFSVHGRGKRRKVA